MTNRETLICRALQRWGYHVTHEDGVCVDCFKQSSRELARLLRVPEKICDDIAPSACAACVGHAYYRGHFFKQSGIKVNKKFAHDQNLLRGAL
jgi:hypothetical protein